MSFIHPKQFRKYCRINWYIFPFIPLYSVINVVLYFPLIRTISPLSHEKQKSQTTLLYTSMAVFPVMYGVIYRVKFLVVIYIPMYGVFPNLSGSSKFTFLFCVSYPLSFIKFSFKVHCVKIIILKLYFLYLPTMTIKNLEIEYSFTWKCCINPTRKILWDPWEYIYFIQETGGRLYRNLWILLWINEEKINKPS